MKLILAMVLAAMAPLAAADDDATAVDRAKQIVAQQMKDPGSAQFRNVAARPYGKTTAVCGEVNAKNSYGGYVGFRKFYVLGDSGKAVVQSGDPVFDPLVEAVCKPAA